jgi:hypothetical protein
MKPRMRLAIGIMSAGFIALLTINPGWAQDVSHARAVRLSFVEGDVTVQRPDVQAWAEAPANTPLQQGFKLSTGENSFAEVQFENGGTIRVGQLSLLDFTELALAANGEKLTGVDLRQGYGTFHPLPSSMGDALKVGTPYGELIARGGTQFRVDLDEGMVRVEVFKGKVQVRSNRGAMTVEADSVLILQPDSAEPEVISQGITNDDWDQWVADRESQMEIPPNGPPPHSYTGYTDESAYGWTELLQYGNWSYLPGSGYGWTPRVHDRWVPYSAGQWCWYPGWGYTWIGSEPWGWLPYHYGGWEFIQGKGWVWFPGSLRNWSPGRVTWFRGPDWVGWVPRHHRTDANIACGNNCGGGVVSAAAFRNGGLLTSNLMLGVNPTSGARLNEPGIVPTMAAKLPGPTVSLPAWQNRGSRGRPINPAYGAGAREGAMPSTVPRRIGVAPSNSTIVFDPAQNRYVNGRRVMPPQAPPSAQAGGGGPSAPAANSGLVQPVPVENRGPQGRPVESQGQFQPNPATGSRTIRPVPATPRGYTNYYIPPQSHGASPARPGVPRTGGVPPGVASHGGDTGGHVGSGGAAGGGHPGAAPASRGNAGSPPAGGGHPPASGGNPGAVPAGGAAASSARH